MPIWNGTTFNNTLIASATSQLHRSGRVVNQIRGRYALLNVIMGEAMPDGTTFGGLKFARVKRTGGRSIKLRLLGKAISPSVLARGSAELVASTPASFDGIGAVDFRTAPYQRKQYIAGSEIEEIRGREAETSDLINDYYQAFVDGFLNKLNQDICSDALPSATAVGGIRSMVSTGLAADGEGAFATYGLDRSDNDNAFFRSNLEGSVGVLTWQKLGAYQVSAESRGGVLRLGVWNPQVFAKLKTDIESLTQVTYDEKMTSLGARHFFYSGMAHIPEGNLPVGEGYLLDPDTFTLYLDETQPITSGVEEDPSRENAYFMKMRAYAQFLCDRPGSNIKLKGIALA